MKIETQIVYKLKNMSTTFFLFSKFFKNCFKII